MRAAKLLRIPPVFPIDNPSLVSHVPVMVQVLDVNDNPPEVATDSEVIVCESSQPGQVRSYFCHFVAPPSFPIQECQERNIIHGGWQMEGSFVSSGSISRASSWRE